MSSDEENNSISNNEEDEEESEEKGDDSSEKGNEGQNESKYYLKNMTTDNITEFKDYKTDNLDDSEDKWKTYLYKGIKGELRNRLREMKMNSDYKGFFTGLKYEYGFGAEKNLNEALAIYIQSAGPNSKDYLSMARLYDIYRNDNKFKVKKDKNLEMVYLLKSFTYYPISFELHDSNIRFPLNLYYALFTFLDENKNVIEDVEIKLLSYIDELMKLEEYRQIISQRDYNLIKGNYEGYLWSYKIGGKTSYDTLIALSYDKFYEATYQLIYIYLDELKRRKDKEYKSKRKEKENEQKKQELVVKIFDLFQILEKNKYYPTYAEYGYFLYKEMGIYDKALEILKEGYEHNQYNCAFYYFNAFTKSDNQKIYQPENFDKNKFIDILQPLIDSFILGEWNSLNNLFDFVFIIGKYYDLKKDLSDRYMKYLNEIAEQCLSFVDSENGKDNCKNYSPRNIDNIKQAAYHSLGFIYLYGLTSKYKRDLYKAENFINEVIKLNERSEPFYTRILFKIKRRLFSFGALEDSSELKILEKKLFDLYEKNKDYEHYGNSYYYYFGKLYEKGIGTTINLKMAYSYYLKGCKPLHNIFDSFVLVHKRYLALKKVDSKKFDHLNPNKINITKYNVIFRLSIGKDINLLVHDNMKMNQIKNELYKKQDLQRFKIKYFLFQGQNLDNNEIIGKYKIKKDQPILVVVDDKSEILSTE